MQKHYKNYVFAMFIHKNLRKNNVFAENVDENHATKDLFIKEYNYLRKGTILMFNGFNSEQLNRQAHFNGLHIEVGQMARLITGHEQHHLEIIRSRYL